MNFKETIDQQTIVAQCTPQGPGALGLIRLSGEKAWEVAEKICRLSSKKKLSECETHTIHHGSIIDPRRQQIDSVMFSLMRSPRTFTGQDTVEITCHNSQFIIDSIIELSIMHGARLAHHGEFSQRAYLNKKIDLLQAEAINELIHANTQSALKSSLAQLNGSLSQYISSLEDDLITALALSEASFEFLDDEGDFHRMIANKLQNILDKIEILKKDFNNYNVIRQGIRIALIGSVNAGKSQLFNTLVHQKRAIVNEQAGTTRDSIEYGMYKNGMYLTFVDTAGLRQTHDYIEQEGIARSYDEAHKADIILLIIDNSRTQTAQEEIIYHTIKNAYTHKIITVCNKTDLANINTITTQDTITTSGLTGAGCEQLEQAIFNKISHLIDAQQSPFLLNKRHYTILVRIEDTIKKIASTLTDNVHYELLSIELKNALEDNGELTGKSISEAGLNAVFKEFCVGK
ncbi:MAG: tRNA uridine-5-carboxymethylaminomethyl(34) synthesis GTPase MnmE [Candidatus Babeliaceae bacterium]|jgi:tRNA modification GTPase